MSFDITNIHDTIRTLLKLDRTISGMNEHNEWLTFTGSLTEKMEQWTGEAMAVTVQSQGMQKLIRDEQEILALANRQWGWIREVELAFSGRAWVMARTVVPLALMNAAAGRLRLLKQKPLGPVLFNRLRAQRHAIDFFKIAKVQWNQHVDSQALWCRRSIFYIDNFPLLLKEVFLPDHPIYQQSMGYNTSNSKND